MPFLHTSRQHKQVPWVTRTQACLASGDYLSHSNDQRQQVLDGLKLELELEQLELHQRPLQEQQQHDLMHLPARMAQARSLVGTSSLRLVISAAKALGEAPRCAAPFCGSRGKRGWLIAAGAARLSRAYLLHPSPRHPFLCCVQEQRRQLPSTSTTRSSQLCQVRHSDSSWHAVLVADWLLCFQMCLAC